MTWWADSVHNMRVSGANGTSVALTPLRYEFPGRHPQGVGDYDANWLVVRGEVSSPSDPAWTFKSACLTTWECQTLASWLDAVGEGALDAVEFAGTPDFDELGLLAFTEPTVAFSVAAREERTAAVRVHLSLEALPARLRESEPTSSSSS